MEFCIIDSKEKLKEFFDIKGKHDGRLIAFGVYEGEENTFLNYELLKKFDFIYKRIKKLHFKAKKDKNILMEVPSYILIHGMGKKSKFNSDYIRMLFADSCKSARVNRLTEISVIVPELKNSYYAGKDMIYLGSSVVEGSELALYEFKKYFSKTRNNKDNDKNNIKSINVYFNGLKIDKNAVNIIQKGFELGTLTSYGTNFSRDLINEPGNIVTPEYLANVAKDIAKEKKLECEIFDEKKIVSMGMNAFYGVAMGSKNPPRFIHLVYKTEKRKKSIKKIAIIGKGITFDSGGLSLKPADYMTTMKSDKSGACGVLAIMQAIGDFPLPLDIEIHGIIAACENMPGGGAQRPDDIVKALNGKTIEIENTDAEGRLTLADALSFAGGLGVDEIIDMATLTGACVIALGEYTSGVMGNDKNLINKIISAGDIAGERMWELPFDDNMREKLISPVADIKNIGNKYGGAITAGMFLEEFVQENVKWCHIDIAGPSFTKTGFSYNPKGATGVGVRTILYYISRHAS